MVFVAKRGKNDLFLEIGKTIYPFEMELPKNLPTSFHHKRGRIFYRVRATIEISKYELKKNLFLISKTFCSKTLKFSALKKRK